MALSYSNVLGNNKAGNGTALTLGSSAFSTLSPSAIANAKARGLGANLTIASNGKVDTRPSPLAPQTTPASTGVVNPSTVANVQTPQPQTQPIAPAQPQVNASANIPTAQPAATQAATPTYSGLVGNLATIGQNGSQAATGAAQNLVNTGATNPGADSAAAQRYNTAANQYAQDSSAFKKEYGGLLGQTGIPLPFSTGRAASYAQNVGSVLQGEAQGLSALQQGVANTISGTQTQQTGLNEGGSLALNNQGQKITALNNAASAAAPQLGSIGQVPFSPIDQNQGNVLGSTQSGGLQGAGQLLGQFQGAQALGAAQGTGQAQGIQAVASAPGQSQAANIQTQNTASTQAAAAAYGQYFPQVLDLGNQLANVTSLGNLLLQTGGGGQVNPFDAQFANQTLNRFKSQLSNADQLKFNQTLATFQGAASTLLAGSSSVTPTQVTDWTNGLSSGNITMSALKEMLSQAETEGQLKLDNTKATAAAAAQFGGIKAPGGATAPQTSAAGSTSGFGWNG